VRLTPDPEADGRRLVGRAEELAQAGSWEWDLETDRVLWSANLYRIFGLEPGEITPSTDSVLERTHVDDRDRLERAVERARTSGQAGPLEYRIVRADGVVRHVRALQPAIERDEEGIRRLTGSLQDVTDWWHAERQVAVHVAVSESLGHWETFEHGATELLSNLARALDCLAGVLWVPGEGVLAPRALWHSQSLDASEFETGIRGRRLPRGGGFPGAVWQTKAPRTRSGEGDEYLTTNGVPSLVGIPALYREEVMAVLEFFSPPGKSDLSERLIASLVGVGYELGEFLSHRRGELTPRNLTPRELEVLQLASQGRTAREIAALLVVSPSTVATHFKHIYAKYEVSDRASAVAKALREGLIE
jgi:PAS domain S-box-containing protein